jgi:pimeloyl-ACP methyl ester carboxylesterase
MAAMADSEPLVLLHPLGMSPRVWDGVLPLLEPHREVVALTALGTGAAPHPRSVR